MILSLPDHFLLKRDRGKREIRGKSKRSQPCFRVFRVFRGDSLFWLRLRQASPGFAALCPLREASRLPTRDASLPASLWPNNIDPPAKSLILFQVENARK